MSDEQMKMIADLMRQNETLIEMNYQILQVLAPIEFDDDDTPPNDRITIQ